VLMRFYGIKPWELGEFTHMELERLMDALD
jgi:hypothetical protein